MARLRGFWREPGAVLWVYGLPLLLSTGLAIAFRNRPVEQIFVDVQEHPAASETARALEPTPELVVAVHGAAQCRERLRLGKSSLVVVPGQPVELVFDPTRPESRLARSRVEDALQRAAGRRDPLGIQDRLVTEPGARYIDFLVPGLLGMDLLGSGLWGVGFAIVDMRVRKLLKRLAATPMNRSHFLASIVLGRLVFMIPEVLAILGGGVLLFRLSIRGTWLAIGVVSLVGVLAFSGLGLLAASRARRIETVSGVINLIVLPMWLLSGIFFSPERFPGLLQPLVQALPLTQLNNALRAVVLEGASLASQASRLLYLAVLGGVSYGCALRWFRWN